jgi:hypothetical protein
MQMNALAGALGLCIQTHTCQIRWPRYKRSTVAGLVIGIFSAFIHDFMISESCIRTNALLVVRPHNETQRRLNTLMLVARERAA